MTRMKTLFIGVSLAGILSIGAAAPVGSTSAPVDWTERLEALEPDRPMDYFELAEEVADAASSDTDLALARHLFGLAGVLDRPRLGRSACLALADLETDDVAKRRLRALADLLDQTGEMSVLRQTRIDLDDDMDRETILGVGNVFSFFRSGNGPRALNEMRDNESVELLMAQYEFLFPGGLARFKEDCARLRSTRIFNDLDTLKRQLHLENALLSGSERTWDSDLAVTDHATLIDVDPSDLEKSLGVDARLSVHRNGHWVMPPLR